MTPEKFGDFELLSLLAQGGMAELFLARHRPTEQLVVVKRLLPELEERPDIIDLFLTEADIGRLLRHENVVQVLDGGEVSGRYYLVMEYVDGVDAEILLSDATRRGDPIAPRIIVRLAVDALRGLHAAHMLTSPQGTSFGLVHRDVSPDNIFITRAGVPKVADFGIAKLASLEGVTSTGLLKGKLTYMSPEQVQQKPLDGRADEFAVGLIVYEMLSGQRPFSQADGETEIDALLRVRKGKVPPLRKLEPGLPRALCKVVDKALRPGRWRRYKSCGAFADALEEVGQAHDLLGSHQELAALVERVQVGE